MIYHIRRRLRRQEGNQYYKDYSNRGQGAYCGENYTDHDIKWRDKIYTTATWQCCPVCAAARKKEQEGL